MSKLHNLNIAIIDYEAGNLFSVQHACSFVGLNATITADRTTIMKADGAILPGVGAFGEAMANLRKSELDRTIGDFVLSGKPFMGICLGLQLLFSESEEFGLHQGLDLIKGRVIKFPLENPAGSPVKVPQIGWNQISPPSTDPKRWNQSPLRGVQPGEWVYFVHSFYVNPTNPDDILTLTNYQELNYCSSIQHHNIFATQFHPEKSAQEGIKVYRNWAEEVRKFKEKA